MIDNNRLFQEGIESKCKDGRGNSTGYTRTTSHANLPIGIAEARGTKNPRFEFVISLLSLITTYLQMVNQRYNLKLFYF